MPTSIGAKVVKCKPCSAKKLDLKEKNEKLFNLLKLNLFPEEGAHGLISVRTLVLIRMRFAPKAILDHKIISISS